MGGKFGGTFFEPLDINCSQNTVKLDPYGKWVKKRKKEDEGFFDLPFGAIFGQLI
jgi:hypothetical protein